MQISAEITEILDRLAFAFHDVQPMIPTYLHLILSALFPIYAASHASLCRPASAAKPKKRSHTHGEGDEEEDVYYRMEGLSISDAVLFPVLAGLTLTGLYVLIKWLEDPELLNKILNLYFSGLAIIGVTKLVSDLLHALHSFIFPKLYVSDSTIWLVDGEKRKAWMIQVNNKCSTPPETTEAYPKGSIFRDTPLPGTLSMLPLPTMFLSFLWAIRDLANKKWTVKFSIHRLIKFRYHLGIFWILGLTVAVAATTYNTFVAKPWWITNLMGFAFSYSALQLISPTTFGIGSLILAGLFLYDIYMVFYTPMMVTVAKALDVPIKLVFPRPAVPGEGIDATRNHAMLGLGDIVLPGIMIGLALRFDLHLHYLLKQRKSDSLVEGQKHAGVIKARYIPPSKNWANNFWTSSWFANRSAPVVPLDLGMFRKTYFNASVSGYVLGMLATLSAMQIYEHAQPALLYLVPGVLGALWLTAIFRGDLKEMMNYSEESASSEDVKVSTD